MLGTLHPLCHRQLRVERLVKIENLEIKANFKPQVVRHKLVAYNLQFDIAICDIKFMGRPSQIAARVHGAGNRHALKCSP